MILRALPKVLPSADRLPAFGDHVFFTGGTTGMYQPPERQVGLALVGMLGGGATCRVNGRAETCAAGSYLVVNQGSRLGLRAQGEPVLLFFKADLARQAVDRVAGGYSWLERAHPMSREFRERMSWLAEAGDSCSSFGALMADAMIRDILEDLTARATGLGLLSERLSVARASTRVELIRRLSMAREWILEHYGGPVTLEDMASVTSLNRQHFLRMFHQVYHVTPHQFLTRTRLDKAAALLRETAEPVSRVCQLTGFESLSSFSGLFKARFGESPTAYRGGFRP